MIKMLRKLGIEKFLNLIKKKPKTLAQNPTANIIINGERLNALPLRLGVRQECPLLSLLFKMVLEVLTV